jgi:hypothetical protein
VESDPQDPHVLGLPYPDPLVRGTDSDPDPSLFLIKVLGGLKDCLQNKILTQNVSRKLKFLRLKIMRLWVSYKEKNMGNFFCILRRKEVGSGIDTDPDSLVRGTDPRIRIRIRIKMSQITQHCFQVR